MSRAHAHHRLAVVEVSPAVQLAALLAVGVVTAVTSAYVKRGLGISGSSIIWTVVPTMFGMAAFPRRFAGSTIAAAALATSGGLFAFGAGSVGPAALTSFVMTGVLADVVVSRVRPGWPLYVGLAVAGLLANVAAFGSHVIESLVRVAPGASADKTWALQIASYALCGAAAGFLAATLAYQLRRRS